MATAGPWTQHFVRHRAKSTGYLIGVILYQTDFLQVPPTHNIMSHTLKGLNCSKIFKKKIKKYWHKLCSLLYAHFALPILPVLILVSDRVVLYENVAFSMLEFCTRKQSLSIL